MNCWLCPSFVLQEARHERAQTLARILDGLAGFDGSEPRFLPRAILHRVEVERQNLLFALALHALVKSCQSCRDPAAPRHLFDEGGTL